VLGVGVFLILCIVFVPCVVLVVRRTEWRMTLIPFFGAIGLFGAVGGCLAGTHELPMGHFHYRAPSDVSDLLGQCVGFLIPATIVAMIGCLITWDWPTGKDEFPDYPRCRKCGYSLRGLTTLRCPECATPFSESRRPR